MFCTLFKLLMCACVGLAAPIVDALMKASPTLVYLFFGRKSILSSTAMWQSILCTSHLSPRPTYLIISPTPAPDPPIFVSVIDKSLTWLFNWRGSNITHSQKLAAYAHLFSFASVKSVVHWFQIMRSGEFLMWVQRILLTIEQIGFGLLAE
jgi:lysosomal acid lipase/cholesteryl ester hydrolase